MLELEDVHFYYGRIHALQGVSLKVPAGRVVCLIGSNGAGKSTTLMAVSGVHAIARGAVRFEGRPIHGLPPDQIVRLGISQVPEGRRIFPLLTVLENLEMGAYLRRDAGEVERDLDQVYSLFPVLHERRRQRGGTLSGGEQQMLAIGRALMARPRLLLLDEPSLGLAPMLVEAIFGALGRIREQGTGIFLVEQNAHVALGFADWVYVMETGRIVMDGPPEELRRSPAVREAYLGE
ncbi:MAG: ABC transporter ATP-binding protein [Candidatus Tectomicrobia bacterium]|nr:ABC transporter ATP-binding protein [Candidatus Tectomicrobia bacterium]